MGTFDNAGRFLVNAWPGTVPVFLNADDNKYYIWLPTTVNGVVTGYWQEMPTVASGYTAKNEDDGVYYRWVPETVDGTVTGRWDAV
jgi:hypothetical protein